MLHRPRAWVCLFLAAALPVATFSSFFLPCALP
jgi:hypothetical protein